jgi:hypothetical protein
MKESSKRNAGGEELALVSILLLSSFKLYYTNFGDVLRTQQS